MINGDNEFGELGWGLKSLAKGAVKGVSKGVSKGVRTTKTVGKLAVKTALVPVKVVGKISKAAFNLLTQPIRSRLNTVKNRRAAKLATDAGRPTPTAADHARARSETKSMLSRKGVHGKMLSYLAGGTDDNILMGEFGAAGVDDAAIAAAVTALVALASKIVTDTAKSGFAPVAKKIAQGQQVVQAVQTAPTRAVKYVENEATSAQEIETVAEEETQEAVDKALEGTGCFFGSADAVMIGANPASMRPRAARKIAAGTHKTMMQMTPWQLKAVGGDPALRTGLAYKAAVRRGDRKLIKRLRPGATQIAARAAAHTQRRAAIRAFGLGVHEIPEIRIAGLDAETITLLGALDGAQSQDLACGLAGADTNALEGVLSDPTKLALIPSGLAVVAGLWMTFKG